jgi:hypothetical protein
MNRRDAEIAENREREVIKMLSSLCSPRLCDLRVDSVCLSNSAGASAESVG